MEEGKKVSMFGCLPALAASLTKFKKGNWKLAGKRKKVFFQENMDRTKKTDARARISLHVYTHTDHSLHPHTHPPTQAHTWMDWGKAVMGARRSGSKHSWGSKQKWMLNSLTRWIVNTVKSFMSEVSEGQEPENQSQEQCLRREN